MRQFLTTAAALALTVGAANAQDAAPPPADPAPVAGDANGQQQVSDAEFVAGMSTSLVWVREAAELALLRAQSGDVGVFADRLRSEHAAAIDELLAAVEADGLAAAVPDTINEAQRADYQALEAASDEEFDRLFLDKVTGQLSDLVLVVGVYANGDESTQLQMFADSMLPIFQAHYQRARELAAEMGVTVDAADAAAVDGERLVDADGAADPDAGADARIIVEQPAPVIQMEQGETRVFVDQPPPEVTVMQNPPQIIVRQPAPIVRIEIPEPRVTIDMPEPEIIVRMADPDIALNMQDPIIRVEQEPPRVTVVQAEPDVRVDVDGADNAAEAVAEAPVPIVEMGERQAPVVNIQRAEPNVEFQADDPQIEFQQAGQPAVEINRVGDQVVQIERPEGVVDADPADGADPVENYRRVIAGLPPAAVDGDFDERTVGEIAELELINDQGEVLGDVEEVVELNGRRYIIIGHGGFLGLGEREVAIPLDAVYFNGEALVMPGLTEEQIEQTEEIDLDDFDVLDDDDAANVPLH